MVAGEAQVRNLISKYQAEKLFECRGPRNAQIKVTESSCRISNLYLFICHMITITKRRQKKKKWRKKWQGGLKETIKLMLIRPPQLQFFEDGIKITATDTK